VVIIFTGFVAILFLDFYFLDFEPVEFKEINIEIPKFERPKEELTEPVDIKEDVDGPEKTPIVKEHGERGIITRQGIIQHTNKQREDYGLPSLEENEKLNQAAMEKARDMFENQYFAHQSPDGKGAEDLVGEAGYEYILVGENLAMGLFENNEDLVEGWMNSPDHRKSILTEGYQEIGIGVGKDDYEGNEIWMAVQIFGTPITACPEIDSQLLARIEEKHSQLDELKEEIEYYEELISEMSRRDDDYNEKIEEYNQLVEEYNAIAENLKALVEDYNAQVEEKNKCLETYEL